MTQNHNPENLLEIRNLKKYFNTPSGSLHAVDDLTLDIKKGKTVGMVGESGCGKSTAGRTILRLLEPTDGKVFFDGEDLSVLNSKELRAKRKDMQMIFQDPFSSLNPRKTIAQTIMEPMIIHKLYSNDRERMNKTLEIMDTVGLAQRLRNSYPHELDGGRRQRIGIARALALGPKFIVCDEPVSALDVSIQAQILNLMDELQDSMDLTYLFITHDLSVVYHFSDEIIVMYLGKMIEMGASDEIFSNPLHPYTKALLSAIPVPNIHHKSERILLEGEITSPIEPPKACRFANRCREAMPKCFESEPEMSDKEESHLVSCFLYSE